MRRNRRSIRLRDYDYTQNGAYFVTICTHERACLFGDVIDGDMVLNECGAIVQSCWEAIPAHHPMVVLDAFVIMPNHLHGVIVIVEHDDSTRTQYMATVPASPPNDIASPETKIPPQRGAIPNNVAPNSLGSIVRTFKAAVTRHINRLPGRAHQPVWQRNYYEHIIRNAESFNHIRAYIINNPAKWADDSLYTSSGFSGGKMDS